MIDDVFIFDGVVHVVDWSLESLRSDLNLADPAVREETIKLANRLTGDVFDFSSMMTGELPEAMKGTPAANYDLIFGQAPTDIAMVGSLAFGPSDEYLEPNYSIKLNHQFAAAYPERCLFAGGVQPQGRDLSAALEAIEYQVTELNAKSIKFYPFEWHCDDEAIAYPLYEKCREMGIKVVQFHLCLPGDARHNVEMQRPNGLQNPARDFPDLTFVMHHPLPLYFDETLSIVQRFPNIYLLISPLLQLSLIKPRLVQELLGSLLQQVGSEKLIYGSEGAMGGNPTRYVEAMLNFEIPQDLRDGYGYPQVTEEDKRNILGLNFARLFDVDVDAKLTELEGAR
jgi:hypothetical protein